LLASRAVGHAVMEFEVTVEFDTDLHFGDGEGFHGVATGDHWGG
jgi:hypothetical protein